MLIKWDRVCPPKTELGFEKPLRLPPNIVSNLCNRVTGSRPCWSWHSSGTIKCFIIFFAFAERYRSKNTDSKKVTVFWHWNAGNSKTTLVKRCIMGRFYSAFCFCVSHWDDNVVAVNIKNEKRRDCITGHHCSYILNCKLIQLMWKMKIHKVPLLCFFDYYLLYSVII